MNFPEAKKKYIYSCMFGFFSDADNNIMNFATFLLIINNNK